jgi:LmbE family N-acetylglucosaminyl deacetylase
MELNQSSKYKALVVVAHPHDETTFFGGTILSKPEWDWTVVCVTDGKADDQGQVKSLEFQKACESLGVSNIKMIGLPDEPDSRLNIETIAEYLKEVDIQFETIFTHSPHGEYGHPHHQDVSYAVHQAFKTNEKIWSVAYNLIPEWIVPLTEQKYLRKASILWNIYQPEAKMFLNNLPVSGIESFLKVSIVESEMIYSYLTEGVLPDSDFLDKYKWLFRYLYTMEVPGLERQLLAL